MLRNEEVALGAVIARVGGLEAGEAAGGAGGFSMEPSAIGVELVFDEVFVVVDSVFLA